MSVNGYQWSDFTPAQIKYLRDEMDKIGLADRLFVDANSFNSLPLAKRQALFVDLAKLNIVSKEIDQLKEEIKLDTDIKAAVAPPTQSTNPVIVAQDDKGTASTGQVTQDAQAATDDGARTQAPAPPQQQVDNDGKVGVAPSTTTAGTNAIPSVGVDGITFGTDAATRPVIQTQATTDTPNIQIRNPPPPPRVRMAASTGDDDIAVMPEIAKPITKIGVGAGNADNVIPNRNATLIEIDNIFNQNQQITPQPNVLDQYASYTYNASVYLLSPTDYANMMKEKKATLRGAQLLFQSGGATINTVDDQIGRNKFFKTDYYIDTFSLKSQIAGQGTGAAHNTNEFIMTVIEPYGITFLSNLKKAVNEFLGTIGDKDNSYTSQIYLLAIRFYGYDQNGKLVRGGNANTTIAQGTNATPGGTDSIIEKFYPFQLNEVQWKIAGKAVAYTLKAATPATQIAASSDRGTIKFGIELSGITLSQAFSGTTEIRSSGTTESQSSDIAARQRLPTFTGQVFNPQLGTATGQVNAIFAQTKVAGAVNTPPPNAAAAPTTTKTVRRGLMDAMNQQQLDAVGKQITYPDRYFIEFTNPAIANALIKASGSVDKTKTAMICGPYDTVNFDPRTQSMNINSYNLTITPGQQLVQVIELITRNSTYIKDQQTVDVAVGSDGKQTLKPIAGAGKHALSWFKIGMKAVPNSPMDPLRHDYAYDITYTLSFYKLAELTSSYFVNDLAFPGVHKSYNYWFTGENTSVISFENTMDALYTQTITSNVPNGEIQNANLLNSLVKRNSQPRSDASSFGSDGRVNEAAANAADELYSPAVWNEAKLNIVGDPAWLQQGEASVGLAPSVYFNPFLPDGTINFESQEILFEIAFNKPTDYDLQTGLMDVGANNFGIDPIIGRTPGKSGPGRAAQNYVFKAREVLSEFKQGKFTQTIMGAGLRMSHTDVNADIALDKEAADLRLMLAENARVGTTSTVVAAGINNLVSASQGDVRKSDNAIAATAATPSIAAQPKPPTSFGQFIGTASAQLQNTLGQALLPTARAAGNVVTKSVNDAINSATSPQIVNTPSQVMAATDDAYSQVDPNAREDNTDLIQTDGVGPQDTQTTTLNENSDIGGL